MYILSTFRKSETILWRPIMKHILLRAFLAALLATSLIACDNAGEIPPLTDDQTVVDTPDPDDVVVDPVEVPPDVEPVVEDPPKVIDPTICDNVKPALGWWYRTDDYGDRVFPDPVLTLSSEPTTNGCLVSYFFEDPTFSVDGGDELQCVDLPFSQTWVNGSSIVFTLDGDFLVVKTYNEYGGLGIEATYSR